MRAFAQALPLLGRLLAHVAQRLQEHRLRDRRALVQLQVLDQRLARAAVDHQRQKRNACHTPNAAAFVRTKRKEERVLCAHRRRET